MKEQTLMMSQSLAALATAEEHKRHLPMPPEVFGLLMFAGFLVLLGITFAFRSVAAKH